MVFIEERYVSSSTILKQTETKTISEVVSLSKFLVIWHKLSFIVFMKSQVMPMCNIISIENQSLSYSGIYCIAIFISQIAINIKLTIAILFALNKFPIRINILTLA